MSWSPQQEQALAAVQRWLKDLNGPQVFRLFGYAGTGKTTLAQEIARQSGGKVLFGAFTGKAALVLQSRGCTGASTIHRMIYRVETDAATGLPVFELNDDSDVRRAALVIIDECSMVDEQLGSDLLSFGTKVLVLGDPAQLPPVRGAGFFTSAEPDVMLTEIHRQAADNPIIAIATRVREGHRLKIGNYGHSRIMSGRPDQADVLGADQVLVGMNRTRQSYNARIRELKGITSPMPIAGERLVCLANKTASGFLNGGLWSVSSIVKEEPQKIVMRLIPEDSGMTKLSAEANVHPFFFLGRERELDWRDLRSLDQFTFGYALTTHKAQGSQWPDVMVFDESGAFRSDRARWLYTAITRASDRITVVM